MGLRSSPRCAGSRKRVTESVLLCQSQAVWPLRIKSLSPICTGAASRSWAGPPYQILSVCDPASSDVIEVGFWSPGNCGTPSEAVSTTVPVSGGGAEWSPASAASSSAGVRGGSDGAACATVIAEIVATAATAAITPAGTAHLPRRENLGMADIDVPHRLHCTRWAYGRRWPPGHLRGYLPVLCSAT